MNADRFLADADLIELGKACGPPDPVPVDVQIPHTGCPHILAGSRDASHYERVHAFGNVGDRKTTVVEGDRAVRAG